MTLKQFALDYESCSIDELKGFVKARTGTTANEDSTKGWCINRLRIADDAATFDFQRLIPELRNCIYRELLILLSNDSASKRTCWPQILATSKAIHEEGVSILHYDNKFEVTLSQTFRTNYVYDGKLHQAPVDITVDGRKFGRYHYNERLPVEWPMSWRKIPKFNILINMQSAERVPATYRPLPFSTLNFALYSICNFLAEGHSLKDLAIRVTVSKSDCGFANFDDVAKKFLWPLTLIPCPPACEVDGMPKDITEHLLGEMRGCLMRVMNPLAKAKALLEEANSLYILESELGPLQHPFMHQIDECVSDINDTISEPGYVTSEEDDFLESTADKLEGILWKWHTSNEPTSIKRKCEQMLEALANLERVQAQRVARN